MPIYLQVLLEKSQMHYLSQTQILNQKKITEVGSRAQQRT